MTAPRTPSPSKTSPNRALDTPTGNVFQKENSPPLAATPPLRLNGSLTERNQNVMSDFPTTTSPGRPTIKKGHAKTTSLSHIPTLRSSRERADSDTRPALRPSTSTGSQLPSRSTIAAGSSRSTPQRLKLQNPIRLRERLQNEAKAINAAEEGLQWELKRIGEEMARLSGGPYEHKASPALQKVSEKVKALESRIPLAIKELNERNDAVKADLENSLVATETKVKGLEQLYKETTAENELLYERFNTELGKIVRALRSKGKEEGSIIVDKLKEQTEETARLKRENARLKKEVLGLRAGFLS